MTNSEIQLLSLPLIGAAVVGVTAWVGALAAVRRGRKLQARDRARIGASSTSASNIDIDRALNDLNIAIAKRNRSARL